MKKIPEHSVDSVVDRLFCCEDVIKRHPPRILIQYGSLRESSYTRYLAEEAERILQSFGAETKIFNPRRLPLLMQM